MKILNLITVILVMILGSCTTNEKKITVDLVNNPLSANPKNIKVPEIQLKEDNFDFGEISQGAAVTHDFMIKNIGKGNLLISSVKGSCGCTVSEWPKEPILPGAASAVKVTFNSAGKKGKQRKTISLLTNAIPKTKILTIHANVIIPKKDKL